MNNRLRLLAVVCVWGVLLALVVTTYRWVFAPRAERQAAEAKEKAKKEAVAQTSNDPRHKHTVRFAIDSFSGYALFRNPAFAEEMSSRGVKVELVDDGADYGKRLKSLQSGETDMGVFTVDALIKASAELGDMPAVIVAVVDESRGADAMVAHKSVFPNIDALNNSETKFVVVPDSPSETLTRVVLSQFRLDRVSADSWIRAKDAKEVYELYKSSKPGEKKAFVIWEPYLSKLTENADYKTVVDSSKFRGYIIDVVVVSRDYLLKHEAEVGSFVEGYLKTNFVSKPKMEQVLYDDAAASGEVLSKEVIASMVSRIRWVNTMENYAHFGLSGSSGLQHIEDVISNLTKVLVKTGAMKADPTNGKPNVLYYDKVLRHLSDANFHPGREEIVKDRGLAKLAAKEWEELLPVGTLEVPRLVFARGTSTLTTQSEEVLTELVGQLKVWPQYYLTVFGNCSREGDVEANKKLASARAESVVQWLVRAGVDANRVRAVSAEPNGSTTVAFVLGQRPY
jgi:flagellar motor protein MotB